MLTIMLEQLSEEDRNNADSYKLIHPESEVMLYDEHGSLLGRVRLIRTQAGKAKLGFDLVPEIEIRRGTTLSMERFDHCEQLVMNGERCYDKE